ncbi:hypothetical protein OS493_008170 [Desmophyllum pertusum]|uniref:Protein kinase domain-containing protein n=1 Tax=Desmophyllum pertusum TaxID=174260 RepID=A0A9X0A4K7_9CNID|nr:hypothetical protein OS493_008170 [Desmophyllum pertusum]
MAPEQLSGKPADQPGDAFSFGILVWECVTRKRPLKYVKSLRQLTKATVDPRVQKIPANWSQTFKILIGDCLKDAPNRPNFQQIYGWLSAIVTSQFACVRPTSFVIEQYNNLFPSKK